MLQGGYDIALEVAKETADYAPEATMEDLSRINPWRDLLPSQDGVLRELIYIGHVLQDLTPTTLPEDDYQLFSDLLRSLETRTDLSWRVYEETEIRNPIMYACNRKPIPDEPFDISKRVDALHKYWDGLAILPDKPGRWEDASDTTFIPPKLRGRQISDGEGGASSQVQDHATYRLTLTPEQDAEATRVYKKWRENRDSKVSYLKLHPPTPIAWVPVSGSNTGASNAWNEVFPNGDIGAGRHVASSKLVGNKKWKPIFRSLMTETIPFSWVDPALPEVDWEKELKESTEQYERSKERRARQSEYQQVLKAKLSEGNAKEEL
ncbi:uncharacterized protein BDZ99DRAFT_381631 [Mytilinidion resinicola]|uniref:Uncharacterized protein n=1 Tax=Mytilinidion resinicola TaxID=574789 RepID=A0A6A6YVY0_9PEZI|nr:uncharacterized protein BDZ99DRAFT_381631 [Mytilinidion resinicola]KAF2812930.1 hypothetical protein BDZ99DRAFT_381631 [Mytilinidion resinicola]